MESNMVSAKISYKNHIELENLKALEDYDHKALEEYDLCYKFGKHEPRNGVSYSKRRMFLKSYPLPWEDDDDEHLEENESILEEEESDTIVIHRPFKGVKRVVHALTEWRLTVLLFKKLKRKAIAYYMNSCHGLKLHVRSSA